MEDDPSVYHPPQYKEIFEFICRHKETIRDINIEYGFSTEPFYFPFLMGANFGIPTEVYENIADRLKEVQLKRITISPSTYEGLHRFDFGNLKLKKIILSRKTLINLNICYFLI